MNRFAKLLSLVLALVMTAAVAYGEGAKLAAEAQTPVEDVEAYTAGSRAIYDAVLGDFYAAYQKAKEAEKIGERFALMAVAEAKLLGSAIMIPLTSQGGNYAMSRVAPRTASSVLWGSDGDRIHQALIVDSEKPLLGTEVAEMRAKWFEVRGTGTYEEWAKGYLAEKGYKLTDVYNTSYGSDAKTWDALATSKAADTVKIIHTFDGLYEYDIENELKPALALSHELSEDGLTYTFHLREGVKWVDSQGREVASVKADDFVAGMQHMCDADGGLGYLVSVDGGCGIAGVDAYISGETSDFATVGVKALDDLTVQYTLVKPCPFFLTMLSYNVFAPMSREYFVSQGGAFGEDYAPDAETYLYGKDPDHIAYCGPYLVTNMTSQNSIVYQANPAYWNADKINIHTYNWMFNDGKDTLKNYNDFKAGLISGTGLSDSSLKQAKADGLFDDYHYVVGTDAVAFMGFFNLNRHAFSNFNDATKAVSAQTVDDAQRTRTAMQNLHFRRALLMSLDRSSYNAQDVGEDLKLTNLINSYTPGNFVMLPEETTVDINGTPTTFPKDTFYGEIMQAQMAADGLTAKVFDKEIDGGSSAGFDGWYNPEQVKAELDMAVKELMEQGVEITKDMPIQIDLPVFISNERFANRAEVLRQSVDAATEGLIRINKISCATYEEWLSTGYNAKMGHQSNYDVYDLSGWGPDYGDPQTYLDTMLPDYAGYMVKTLGIF